MYNLYHNLIFLIDPFNINDIFGHMQMNWEQIH